MKVVIVEKTSIFMGEAFKINGSDSIFTSDDRNDIDVIFFQFLDPRFNTDFARIFTRGRVKSTGCWFANGIPNNQFGNIESSSRYLDNSIGIGQTIIRLGEIIGRVPVTFNCIDTCDNRFFINSLVGLV